MAKAKRAAKKTTAGTIWKRIGLTALVLFIITGLTGLGAFAYLYATTDLPDPNADFQTNTTFLYYNDGTTQLGSLAVQNRVTLDYAEMPQLMKDAVVAAENRSFWEDPGFSASGIARSMVSIATGGELQGGSTITQQYIKILYLDSGQRLSRKVKELFLAIKMGRELSKEEILEGYLNTIYFGRGAYGIQAAAKSYFLKDASALTIEETAALAAILNNPAGFNPSGGPEKVERLLGRYQYVLDGMLEMGAITDAEHVAARPQLPAFPEVPVNDRYGGPKGFLIKAVEDELLASGFTEGEIQGGGLKVTTTFDESMQAAAVETAQKYTAQAAEDAEGDQDPAQLHAAIASVDTATGGVLAMYGGPDYVASSRNWAMTDRPAASTFKTFATIAGLRNGFSLKSIFNGNTFTPDGDTQTIRNEFSNQYGPVTLREATAESINTAFVDMTQQIPDGANQVITAANDAGAPTSRGWDANNRIALGAAEVSPVNMATAYATLANSGRRNPAHVVAKVEGRNGEVLLEANPEGVQSIDQNVAANVTDSLTSVVQEGTGRRASELGRPVAGKTGTNGVEDDITSAWFVGYTRQISTAVMYVAGDSGNEDLDDYKRPQDPTFFGSSYPLMTWVEFMTRATDGMPVEQFDVPREIRATKGSESASPSPTPTPSPSETPSETPSPTPSEEPTTETPTPEPTEQEPTEEPTPPGQSGKPTPPGQSPEPTPTPSETVEETVTEDAPGAGAGVGAGVRPTPNPTT
ncbi:penicillin-binding protein [Tessaracoccus sp. MC1627]|uniref:transglycosylase domain-containing protein n=1 Tax=Tessaracoccus sp. MC1627 TaxID=2760312 RepID=UPI00160128FA|nr:transglycosylase domain-containing protein [Tessaracoccus sp. MC1627]MBB1511360.1 penicillin-binding protein [Tessaracoccus sp. MC1627]